MNQQQVYGIYQIIQNIITIFKIMQLHLALLFALLILTHQTCWINSAVTHISQKEIVATDKYQFSIHPASGKIVSRQRKQGGNQNLFFGDFSILRVYSKNSVSIYEGLYLKIKPLKHFVSPWLASKYQAQNILQIQIVFSHSFGNKQIVPFDEIGMSYFVVGTNLQNQTSKQVGVKLSQQLLKLEKGRNIKFEDYFGNSNNLANNVYLYKTTNNDVQVILPISQQNQKSCTQMLWLIQRNIVQMSLNDVQMLKQKYHLQSSQNANKNDANTKVYAAKLQNEQAKVVRQQRKQRQKQKESNSCPQGEQL